MDVRSKALVGTAVVGVALLLISAASAQEGPLANSGPPGFVQQEPPVWARPGGLPGPTPPTFDTPAQPLRPEFRLPPVELPPPFNTSPTLI